MEPTKDPHGQEDNKNTVGLASFNIDSTNPDPDDVASAQDHSAKIMIRSQEGGELRVQAEREALLEKV
jgi:hypothetical protein